MFATSTSTASDPNPWFQDEDLLLSPQDVLDYTSFSDDSQSPILSMDSFSSANHSPDLSAYCFQDFAPLDMPSFQSTPLPTNDETARQAALLHAYLASQTQTVQPQAQAQPMTPQWTAPSSSTMAQELIQHAQMLEQRKQLEEQQRLEQEQKEREEKRQAQLIQMADAQNLARYLAQTQKEIKQESVLTGTAMEHDTVSAPHSPSLSSASSDDKSPMGSPNLTERSVSPDVTKIIPSSSCNKRSRELICFNCKVTQTPLWRRTPDRKHSLCNACGLYYKQYGAHRPLHIRHKLPTVLADVRAGSLPYARPTNMASSGSSPALEIPFVFAPASDSSASSDSDSDSSPGPRSIHSLASLPDLAKMYTDALIRPPIQKTSPPLMTAKQGIECANCSQTQTPLWRKNDAGEPICNACGLYHKLHHRDRPVTMRKTKITRRRRDWGGNLAHQAQAQAQALALAHARAQAQALEALKNDSKACGMQSQQPSDSVSMIVDEMNVKAQELLGSVVSTSAMHLSNEIEQEIDEQRYEKELQQQQPQQQIEQTIIAAPVPVTAPVPAVVMSSPVSTPAAATAPQALSNNSILDENKFSDMVGQMNAHQMNRFLSILETRCGVLRERLLASTEASAQSSLDHLF
ncbi:hypothetical protein FBU30_003596 [Linnemannia zychae]|nr:hypothetical protein FBU30_003596 [Linnemannia zychae]